MYAVKIRTAAIVYGALAVAAVILGIVLENDNIFVHPDGFLSVALSPVSCAVLGGFTGIVFGLLTAKLTRFTVFRFKWAKTLHTEFRGLFGPLKSIEVLAFAVFSSIAEEMFFRGALQAEVGIVIASVVFGLLHIAPGRKFIPWTFQAIMMGFILGGLFWFFGDLTSPILAHFTINYQNLHFINRYDPSLQMPRSFVKSSLAQKQNEIWR